MSEPTTLPEQDTAPEQDPNAGLRLDDDGNLIDPPVIPEYERRLTAAADAADQDEIAAVMAEYTDARLERARARARREQEATA